MKGEQYLTKGFQYSQVYDKGNTWTNRHLVLKVVANRLTVTRYGFAVSRRVGNAVIRNLVKRRLREILKFESLKSGVDLVIIARPLSSHLTYRDLQSSVTMLLYKAGLIAGNNEGSGTQSY